MNKLNIKYRSQSCFHDFIPELEVCAFFCVNREIINFNCICKILTNKETTNVTMLKCTLDLKDIFIIAAKTVGMKLIGT